jgi:hypothetical protein
VIYTRDDDASFTRVDERHELQLYAPSDVVAALEATGLNVETHDSYDALPPLPGWKVFIAS